MKTTLDKLGAIGSLFAAIARPCCLPAIASIGSALGIPISQSVTKHAAAIMDFLAIIALVGTILAYRSHRRIFPIGAATYGVALVLLANHVFFHPVLIYVAVAALFVAAAANLFLKPRACCRCQSVERNAVGATN